jgi:plastocyanin
MITVGDVVAVPFHRSLFGLGQVLTHEPKHHNGVLGIYPRILASSVGVPLESLSALPFLRQERIELTGIVWRHWQTIGHRPARKNPAPVNPDTCSPFFVAELHALDALKEEGLVPADFELFDRVAAHPTLAPKKAKYLATVLKVLDREGFLTKLGKKESATALTNDFSLHSGLLTREGIRFYRYVVDQTSMNDDLWQKTEWAVLRLLTEFRAGVARQHVSVRNDRFAPPKLVIYAGDTVRWVNRGRVHTVTSGASAPSGKRTKGDVPLFDERLENGEAFEYTFADAGSHSYFCRDHAKQEMHGTIIVLP